MPPQRTDRNRDDRPGPYPLTKGGRASVVAISNTACRHPAQAAARQALYADLVTQKDRLANAHLPLGDGDGLSESARVLSVVGDLIADAGRGTVLHLKSRVVAYRRAGNTEAYHSLLATLRTITIHCHNLSVGATSLRVCRAADALYGKVHVPSPPRMEVTAASRATIAMVSRACTQFSECRVVPSALAPGIAALASGGVHLAALANAPVSGDATAPGATRYAFPTPSPPTQADSDLYFELLCATRVARYSVATNHMCLAHNALMASLRTLHEWFAANKVEFERDDPAGFFNTLRHYKAMTELREVVNVQETLGRVRTHVRVLAGERPARGGRLY